VGKRPNLIHVLGADVQFLSPPDDATEAGATGPSLTYFRE
jgi:hypothetical protein